MTTWNVRLAIVELIDADTAEAAIAELGRRVRAMGLDVYVGDGDAFESEVDTEGNPS